ncbi:hypothetical protein JCM6882_004602 [Rhodosporidiobolus microsporus]
MLTSRPLPALLTVASSFSPAVTSNSQATKHMSVIKGFWRSCRTGQTPAKAQAVLPIVPPSTCLNTASSTRKAAAFAGLGNGLPSTRTPPSSFESRRRAGVHVARAQGEIPEGREAAGREEIEGTPAAAVISRPASTAFRPSTSIPPVASKAAVPLARTPNSSKGVALVRTKATRPSPRTRTISTSSSRKPSNAVPSLTPKTATLAPVASSSASTHSSAYAPKLAILNHTLASSPSLLRLPLAQRLSTARAHGLAFIDSEEPYELRLDAARDGRALTSREERQRVARWRKRIGERMEEFAAAASPLPPSTHSTTAVTSPTASGPRTRSGKRSRKSKYKAEDLRILLLRDTVAPLDLLEARVERQGERIDDLTARLTRLADCMEDGRAERK